MDQESHQVKLAKLQTYATVFSAITAIIATIIGAWGVYIGKQALDLNRRFEELRIRPYLEVVYGSPANEPIVYLKNNGLGPGLIKSITFKHNAENLSFLIDDVQDIRLQASKIRNHIDIYSTLNPEEIKNIIYNFQPFDTLIEPAGRLPLLTYDGTDKNISDKLMDLTYRYSKEGSIRVEYCSISGEFCHFHEL